MKRPSKRVLAASGAALALAGGGVGGAIAAAGSDSPESDRQAFLSDAANRLGVSASALENALKQAAMDRVDAALAAGRITKARAGAIKQRIESGQFGPGHSGGVGFRHGLRLIGGAAAAYIGVTQEQLRQEVRSGKSLAQVATEHGKSVDGLKQAIYDSAKKRFDQAVSAGRIAAAQEQGLLDRLKARLDDIVNRTGTPHPPGP